MPVKQVRKKSSKASISISGLVGKPSPNIQALYINTNIVILALYLFQISPKFCEEIRRLMTVPQKPRKKKVVPSAIPIVKEDEEGTRYALLDCHVKANQGSNLIIINPKLVKRLRLKIKPTSTLANHHLGMFVTNGDSIELQSWVKFWVEVFEIQREMWAFVTPKENPNVSLILGLSWL